MADRSKNLINVGDRIRACRLSLDLTQEQLGLQVQKGGSTVRMWEIGKSEPDLETVKKLSNIFDVSVDYLLGNSDIPNPELRIPDEYKDLPIAFYEGAKGLTQDDIDDVVKIMEFLKKKNSDK